MRYEFGGLIFGGAYTWRGLFSEFYGMFTLHGISFAPQRESYRIGFPFTYKTGDLDAISVPHYIWDRFCAMLFVQCEFLFRPWRLKKVSRSED